METLRQIRAFNKEGVRFVGVGNCCSQEISFRSFCSKSQSSLLNVSFLYFSSETKLQISWKSNSIVNINHIVTSNTNGKFS